MSAAARAAARAAGCHGRPRIGGSARIGEDRQVLPSPFQSFALTRPGSLSLREREQIGSQFAEGQGVRQIAGLLERAPSTIGCEVARTRVLTGSEGDRSCRCTPIQSQSRGRRSDHRLCIGEIGEIGEISDRHSGRADQRVPDAAAAAREPHCRDRVDRDDRSDEHSPGATLPVGDLKPGTEDGQAPGNHTDPAPYQVQIRDPQPLIQAQITPRRWWLLPRDLPTGSLAPTA